MASSDAFAHAGNRHAQLQTEKFISLFGIAADLRNRFTPHRTSVTATLTMRMRHGLETERSNDAFRQVSHQASRGLNLRGAADEVREGKIEGDKSRFQRWQELASPLIRGEHDQRHENNGEP